MFRVALIWASVASLLVAGVAAHPAGAPRAGCGTGFVTATIEGKHVCLKAGRRCTKAVDRTYHRYRFHCHGGRLTRFPAAPQPTPPAPSPLSPPTLSEPPAPSGRLVDVGGYRLMVECVGTGAPTVVVEAGAGTTRWGYRKIQYALGGETRVCSYDRPGTEGSQSDPRPAGVAPTSETFARELHTLLANAGEPGPYLLVGPSFGGILISEFTLRYPDLVAGLVFVDSFSPAAAEVEMKSISETWDGRADFEALRTLSYGSRPVIVLETSYLGEGPDFRRRATNIIVAEAPQYTHLVHLDAPGLVYETVRVEVAAARAGGSRPQCASTPIARLVVRCA